MTLVTSQDVSGVFFYCLELPMVFPTRFCELYCTLACASVAVGERNNRLSRR